MRKLVVRLSIVVVVFAVKLNAELVLIKGELVALTPKISALALVELTELIAIGLTVKSSDEHPDTAVGVVCVARQRNLRYAELKLIGVVIVLRPLSPLAKVNA